MGRMGFLLLFVPLVALGGPASEGVFVPMQQADSARTCAVYAGTATYPGGILAFRAWAYERIAQEIVAAATAEYRRRLVPRGGVRNWDSGRLTPEQRRTAAEEWCRCHLPLHEEVTAAFTVTERGRVTEVQVSGTSDEALNTVLQRVLVRSVPWIAARRLSDGQWRSVPGRSTLPIPVERIREGIDKLTEDGTGTTAR